MPKCNVKYLGKTPFDLVLRLCDLFGLMIMPDG